MRRYNVVMTPSDDGNWVLKSEADMVIADLEESHKMEVEQLLIEIAEQKSEIERLEILCANYRHDCDNLAISNEQVKKAARTLLKKMNHNKRKRCLALYEKYGIAAQMQHDFTMRFDNPYYLKRAMFNEKWRDKWLSLAKVFDKA